jgi:hypothetical protein
VADFLAFSINRSTHLATKSTIIDIEFLDLIGNMQIQSNDIARVATTVGSIRQDLDQYHYEDRIAKGLGELRVEDWPMRLDAANSAKGLVYSCPSCEQPVTLRQGQNKIAHFAHKPPTDCSWATRRRNIVCPSALKFCMPKHSQRNPFTQQAGRSGRFRGLDHDGRLAQTSFTVFREAADHSQFRAG